MIQWLVSQVRLLMRGHIPASRVFLGNGSGRVDLVLLAANANTRPEPWNGRTRPVHPTLTVDVRNGNFDIGYAPDGVTYTSLMPLRNCTVSGTLSGTGPFAVVDPGGRVVIVREMDLILNTAHLKPDSHYTLSASGASFTMAEAPGDGADLWATNVYARLSF